MSSLYREAVKRMFAYEFLVCPKCGEADVPTAKPTLEREQNGSLTCCNCGTNFYAPTKE